MIDYYMFLTCWVVFLNQDQEELPMSGKQFWHLHSWCSCSQATGQSQLAFTIRLTFRLSQAGMLACS